MREVRPIELCPGCRYSWRGLPSEGRCPECGFPFTPALRVWVESRVLTALMPIFCFLQLGVWLAWLWDDFDTSLPAGVITLPGATQRAIQWDSVHLHLGFAVLFLALTLWTLWNLWPIRFQVFFAVDRDAVRVRTDKCIRSATWGEIEKVVHGTTYDSIHVRGARNIVLKKPLIRTPYRDFMEELLRRWEARKEEP